ncbi:hypothetical protein ACH6EH_19870 [Paenibacillus sp. JSM ZJ436]|uniref:hypothetical protein n=1 Tax=Paenibacillus sp. JSM ZJ436 TaxID=3376190 RepID=UPI0037BB18CF
MTYSLTVPGNNINDSRGETASQVKKNSYVDAGLRVNSTGGAAIDVRTESSGPDGRWRNVTSSNTYSLDSPQSAGTEVWLQFSTGIFQGPVPTTGEWIQPLYL